MEGDFNLKSDGIGTGYRSRRTGKKALVILLSAVLTAGMCLPAYGAETGEDTAEAMNIAETAEASAEEPAVEEPEEATEKELIEEEAEDSMEELAPQQEEDPEGDEEVLIEEVILEGAADEEEAPRNMTAEAAEETVEGEVEALMDDNANGWLSDYEYQVQGDKIKLTKYVGNDTRIVVPGSVVVDDIEYNAVEISAGLWNNAESLRFEQGVIFPADSKYLFEHMHALRTIDLTEVDTSNVTDMGEMFYDCSSLISLDASTFNTSNVTDMYYMFEGCSNLTSLDVSSFNTSNVTDMQHMFGGCKKLTSLDVSSFDTSNVTNMRFMFYGCSSLTSLDVSSFDTSNVTNMCYMFYGCSSLTSLNLSSFNTANVTNMSYMFENCWKLTNLDISGFDTSSVTDICEMFCNCSSLTSLDVSGFDTSSVTDMGQMFYNCSSLTSLDINAFDTSNVTNMRYMFERCSSLISLNLSNFDTSNVTKMGEMFSECNSLTSLDVSSFDTSNVTDMHHMFYSCKSLTSLDVGNFDTSNVTNMSNMFCGCSKLTTLDLGSFDTSNVTDMGEMFWNCSSLTSLDVSAFDTSNVETMGNMFDYCYSLTNLNVSGFDTSNVENMSHMFYSCKSLTSLDVSDFDTHNVTNMEYMFCFCDNLTSLDISGFDTHNVTSMERMFCRCEKLITLDVSGFDTSSVKNMCSMFDSCWKLSSLDVSGFDTSNVTNMSGMFSNCSVISLDVSGFNTSKVTYIDGMFENCNDLTSLDVHGFDICNVAGLGKMFYGCSSLTSLKVSGLDTSNIKNMSQMFENCSSLTRLDVSGFDTSNVTDMSQMFKDCSSLTNLDMGDLDTSNVTNMSQMFENCNSLTRIDVSDFDTSNVTDMSQMFKDCSSLTNLDMDDLDTSNVTNMSQMFKNSSSLTSLDISGFNTSNVTNMNYMFENCSALTTIICADHPVGWNPSSAVGMFKGCTGLIGTEGELQVDYDSSKLDASMAKPASLGGYFTPKSSIKRGLKISEGPIEIEVGKKAVVAAVYYDEDGKKTEAPGGLKWFTGTGASMGEVNLKIVSDYYEYYLCEVIGVSEGTTYVGVSADGDNRATLEVNVIEATPTVKEEVDETVPQGHLSGSANYTLAETSEGIIDLTAPITSEVLLTSNSHYRGTGNVVIKKGGVLDVMGDINASSITVDTEGLLRVSGRINAGTLIIKGGNWFSSGGRIVGDGVLCADEIIILDRGSMSMTGQIIAKERFEYKSKEKTNNLYMPTTLFIGGDMIVGSGFNAENTGLKTLFYGNVEGRSFEFHKKSNIGKVLALSQDDFEAIGVKEQNRTGTGQYAYLYQYKDKPWLYRDLGKSLVFVWEEELPACYVDLLKNKQTVMQIPSSFGLSSAERTVIEDLAIEWIATIHAQTNSGLLEISNDVYELEFKLNNRKYFLKYDVSTYGSYGQLGVLSFGTNKDDLQQVGISSAASILAFQTQATSYLAEGYVNEYYKFVTGSLPKWKGTSITNRLKKGGTDYVKKYLTKVLFSSLNITESAECREVADTLKITKMVIGEDVEGLWKFAIKKGWFKSTAKAHQTELAELDETVHGTSEVQESENIIGEVTDPYLKKALIETLGQDSSGNPDYTNVQNITYLDLSGKYIQSLDGIQRFTGLKVLIVGGNELSDLRPLSGLQTLQYLDISGQNITDLTPVSGLTGLLALDASDNAISSVEPLSSLVNLERLDISNNPINSLNGMNGLRSLKRFTANGIAISGGDLSALSELSELIEVYMSGSGLESIEGLNTDSLEILDISYNGITSLEDIITAGHLKNLNVSENNIQMIPSLGGCANLVSLDISGNMLWDISGVSDAPKLESLNLSACELSNMDVADLIGLNSLKILDLSYNSIIDDLSPLEELNNLEKVDVSNTDVDTFVQITLACTDPSAGEVNHNTNITVCSDTGSIIVPSGAEVVFNAEMIKDAGDERFFEWQYKDTGDTTWHVFDDGNSATLVKAVEESWCGRKIRCVVSDESGNVFTSSSTDITAGTDSIIIREQPNAVIVPTGGKASFRVSAESKIGKNLSYQWQYQGAGTSKWNNYTNVNDTAITITVPRSWNGWKMRCIISDELGNVAYTKAVEILIDDNVINITKQPESVITMAGKSINFKVTASGSQLSYQWQYQGVTSVRWNNFVNATDATLAKTASTGWNGWKVRCAVTNGSGNTVYSDEAMITIAQETKITKQPESVTAEAGRSISFSVTASGDQLSYQWQYQGISSTKWNNFAGATEASMTKTAASGWDGWKVRCVVADGFGNTVYSDVVTIKITQELKITKQPESVTAEAGRSISFNVMASGGQLSYQWQYKGTSSAKWNNFVNATEMTMTKTVASGWNGWKVRCVIADGFGNTVYSDVATITIGQELKIIKQPEPVITSAGRSINFSVTASGDQLSYQWQYQGIASTKWNNFTSATKAFMAKTAASGWNGWKVRCVVTDGSGNTVYSEVVTITIVQELKITKQPVSVTVPAGQSISFDVIASGDQVSYQWQYQGVSSAKWNNFVNATGASMTKTAALGWNGWKVRCVVTDGSGNTVSSDEVSITIE